MPAVKAYTRDGSNVVNKIARFKDSASVPSGWHETDERVGIGFIDNLDGTFTDPNEHIPTASEILAHAKTSKINDLSFEALTRMQVQFPRLRDKGSVDVAAALWSSIILPSKVATPELEKAMQIKDAEDDAVAVINAFTNINDVFSYNVQTDPNWP